MIGRRKPLAGRVITAPIAPAQSPPITPAQPPPITPQPLIEARAEIFGTPAKPADKNTQKPAKNETSPKIQKHIGYDGKPVDVDWTNFGKSDGWSVPELADEIQRLRAQNNQLQKALEEAEALIGDRGVHEAQAEIFRALMELLPKAKKDAVAGKPALLRMIVRAIRAK